MSVFTATEPHHIGEVQPYTPHPNEWRKTNGSIHSDDWETVTTTVGHGCPDVFDDEAIIKHYLDTPCKAPPGQHIPRQNKSRLRRIRNMLKSAPSGAASTSPFPPLPEHDHLLSKSTASASASASTAAASAAAKAAHKRETLIATVEDMAIGTSSLCSQSSTIFSDPSSSTITTFTTADNTRPHSSPPLPMRPSVMSSRIKFAFSKLSGDHHQPKQVVPETTKLEFRDSHLTGTKSECLADWIRTKLQRPKSVVTMATTTTPHVPKKTHSHSMSSLMQYQQRKSDPLNTATSHSNVAQTSGPKGILRVRPSPSKSTRRKPYSYDRHRSSCPLAPSTTMTMTVSSSASSIMTPGNRFSMPLIQASESSIVRFAPVVSVRETFARHEYDRSSDPMAVCTRLTPAIAHYIKQDLNMYKLHEMHVHKQSRSNTHFFL